MSLTIVSPDHHDGDPLARFDLKTSQIHAALTRGLGSASNRTAMAAPGARGNDIFHDGIEDLASILSEDGWKKVTFSGQVRLVHPRELMCFTLAAAKYVRDRDPNKPPITNDKGATVRESLAHDSKPAAALFQLASQTETDELKKRLPNIPLWMLLNELSPAGLHLEFSRPSQMGSTQGRSPVTDWEERIYLDYLPIDEEFGPIDDPADDFDFDVPAR